MPPLLNHLWQSTVFAALAALLAWTLRHNHARTRHWIWLAASIKFLVPWTLLVTLGMRLAPPTAAPAFHMPAIIDEVSRPLAAPAAPLASAAPSSIAIPITALLLALWACGLTRIAWSQAVRWLRIRGAVRRAARLDIDVPIEVRATTEPIEPGVFGIFRPVLLVPARIAGELTGAQLRAILAHELCHVRRRDNLAALIHMAVETIFWFHPLVWWIGARLIEERERACDEEVVRQGNDAETYAEGILAACRLYLRSPLSCVSGVAGGDLRRRVERIMSGPAACDPGAAKTLLLAVCLCLALAGPIAVGLATAPPSLAQLHADGAFEVASVKPSAPNIRGIWFTPTNGKLTVKNAPLEWIMAEAYQVQPFRFRLANAPGWIRTARYDIDAKAPDPKASKAELAGMLRKLLAERFHLSIHREMKEAPVYSLTVGKGGPKLQPPEHPDGPHGIDYRNGGTILLGRNATMEEFADSISFRMERTVVDKTGLTRHYDFRLEFAPDEFVARFGEDRPAATDLNSTNVFTALQEQLGLKLEAGRGPVEMLVIDRVERPTEN
jgi:bla regulator protein BlaR1